MRHLLKLWVGAFGLAVAAMPTQAAIVTQWLATDSATWLSASSGVTVTPSTLSWGTSTGSGQSSLTITNPAANQLVDTYIGGGSPPAAFTVPGSSITHHNVPILNSPMTGATLRDSLTLTAVQPPPAGSAFTLPTIDFDIAFLETPNVTPCAATSPPGNPCNDIFVLLGGFFNQSFVYDSQTYYVNIFPTSGGVLSILSDSACSAVNAVNSAAPASGCFGFTTPEGGDTTLAFGFTISTEPLSIPEPGTLALAGLAVAGAGLTRLRGRVRV